MAFSKFGHFDDIPTKSRHLNSFRGPPGRGFAITHDGDYDMNGKCLRNVGTPIKSSDAVTKDYVESKLPVSKTGEWHFSFKRLSSIGDALFENDAVNLKCLKTLAICKGDNGSDVLDFQDKRIENLKNPSKENDAVNLKYLSSEMNRLQTMINNSNQSINEAMKSIHEELKMIYDKIENIQKTQLEDIKNTQWIFQNQLRRFSVALYRYFQNGGLARTSDSSSHELSYLNWDEIF